MVTDAPGNGGPRGFKLRHTLEGHTDVITKLAWSPDGRVLASASYDGTVRLWDSESGLPEYVLQGHSDHVNGVAWSPGGSTLASASDDGTVRVWVPAPRALEGQSGIAISVDWSPDGRLIAAGSDDSTIRIWDEGSRALPQTLSGHSGPVFTASWSPDGITLASGAKDATIRIWNTSALALETTLRGHTGEVNSVVWSPAGDLLASCSLDSTIRIWNPRDGRQINILEGHLRPVRSITFSNDGRLLASNSWDHTVRIWRCDTWQVVAVLNEPASYLGLSGIAFNPRAPVLATHGDEDRGIRIWDLDVESLLHAPATPEHIYYSNAKVVIIGDSGVGKSGLGLALSGQPFQPTECTHGRRIWTFDSRDTQVGPETKQVREILLWDLAGQPGYRLLHQLHLGDVAVALMVFDARMDADPFVGLRHWDRALRQASLVHGAAPLNLRKFLVAARMDRGRSGFSKERLNALVQELGCDGYFETSAKEGWQIAELARAVREAIDWSRIPVISSTDLFQSIKNFLRAEKESGRLLSSVTDLYRAFLRSAPAAISDQDLREQFEICIGRVEASGLIRKLSFGSLVLVQPEILDGYASALLNAARDEPDGMGSISEEAARQGRFRMPEDERIKDKGQEALLLLAAIEDLLSFEIGLRVQSEGGAYLVFPSEFTRERSEPSDSQATSVTFSFEGPVLNIYATLAVRLAQSSLFQAKEMWRNAATYASGDGGSCGFSLREVDQGRGELAISFDSVPQEAVRALFVQYISTHLQRYALPESIRRRRTIVCPNPACLTSVGDVQAQRRLERGFTSITCPVCDTKISLLNPNERSEAVRPGLLQTIDDAAASRRDTGTAASILEGKRRTSDFDVFLCYHHNDRAAVQNVAAELRERGILPWLDDWELPPGASWQRAFETQLPRIKSAAVFLGPSGIGPWQDLELQSLLHDFVSRRIPVIPVLLPGAPAHPEWPLFLAHRTYVDLSKPAHDPMELLTWGITGRRPDRHGPPDSPRPSKPEPVSRDQELLLLRDAAIRREDWPTARQQLVELADIAHRQGNLVKAGEFAYDALRIADDPLKMDGKGLKEPLEILAAVRLQAMENWLRSGDCNHRTAVLAELRRYVGANRNDIIEIVKRSGISVWRVWFNTDPPDIARIAALPREGHGWPAIRLRRLRLRNIKSFTALDLVFAATDGSLNNCCAIVGDNATGKSTLLQSIALGCLGPALANQVEGVRARDMLRNGAVSGSIEIEFDLSVDSGALPEEWISIPLGLELDQTEEDFRPLPAAQMTFGPRNYVEHWAALRRQIDFQWGFCAGYGAIRGIRERGESTAQGSTTKIELDRVGSLFLPQNSLIDAATLEAILQSDVSKISRERKNIPLGVTAEIMKMLQEIIPGLKIVQENGQNKLIERHANVSQLSALSDGCTSMIGLLGHLVRHTLELLGCLKKAGNDGASENLQNPFAVVGIVLIDEVDLHLHPSWQRTVLSQLQGAFPGVQFIVTTHSPLVLGATPDVRVMVLKRTDSGGVEILTDLPSVRGWRIDQLLTGIHFDVSSPYDPVTERLTIRYAKLLNEFGAEDPNVIAAEKELAALKLPGYDSPVLDRKAWILLKELTMQRLGSLSDTDLHKMSADLERSYPGNRGQESEEG